MHQHDKKGRRRLFAVAAGTVLSIAGLLATAASANADPGDLVNSKGDELTLINVEALPLAQANPEISLEVIANLPTSLQQRSDLQIDPSITSRTPLVSVNGQPIAGQSPDMMAAATACGSQMVAPLGLWSNPFPSNCGVLGSPGATVTYTVFTDAATSSFGCFQWLGYNPVYAPLSTNITGYTAAWFGGGCVDGGHTVVDPKIRTVAQLRKGSRSWVTLLGCIGGSSRRIIVGRRLTW